MPARRKSFRRSRASRRSGSKTLKGLANDKRNVGSGAGRGTACTGKSVKTLTGVGGRRVRRRGGGNWRIKMIDGRPKYCNKSTGEESFNLYDIPSLQQYKDWKLRYESSPHNTKSYYLYNKANADWINVKDLG